MSIKECRAKLPLVRIRWGGNLYWGRVSGRLNEFASVSPHVLIDRRKLVTTILGPIFHFSWAAVARAAGSGGVLRTE